MRILFASVGGRKRPDRRFCGPRGESMGAIARRAGRAKAMPSSPGSCSGTHSLWAGTAARFTCRRSLSIAQAA